MIRRTPGTGASDLVVELGAVDLEQVIRYGIAPLHLEAELG
jgi:hypothetical protein